MCDSLCNEAISILWIFLENGRYIVASALVVILFFFLCLSHAHQMLSKAKDNVRNFSYPTKVVPNYFIWIMKMLLNIMEVLDRNILNYTLLVWLNKLTLRLYMISSPFINMFILCILHHSKKRKYYCCYTNCITSKQFSYHHFPTNDRHPSYLLFDNV